METLEPAAAKDIQVVKSREELEQYSKVRLNGIIVISTKE